MNGEDGLFNRRQFLGALGVGAATAIAGGLVACSSKEKVGEDGQTDAGAEENFEVSEELSVDIVVVGAGNSGLTATVQAAELGADTLLIEVNRTPGVNTEGIFGVNSHYQREQGIDITMAEVIQKEQVFFNYRVNALFWKDMVSSSGNNIDWLESHGVLFSGQVDNYHNMGHIPVFHWFVDGKGSNLTTPLATAAQELGAQILFETRGHKLIVENGLVKGIYAQKTDGTYLKANSKAVILASGGFIGDIERMAGLGIPEEDVAALVIGRVGDGIDMSIEVGGADRSAKSCFLREASFIGQGWLKPLPDFAIYSGRPIWVNENGERFCNELCSKEASGCVTNAQYTQHEKYALWGQAAYDDASADVKAAMDDALAGLVASTTGGEAKQVDDPPLKKYDTIETLCSATGFDLATVQQTLSIYNAYCDAGRDDDFGKDTASLVRIDPPFYFGRFNAMNMQSIGGIVTNRKMEVVDKDNTPILGLYAIGTDSCMLYGETYTISVPASCNANNINSGRTAARNAVTYLSA